MYAVPSYGFSYAETNNLLLSLSVSRILYTLIVSHSLSFSLSPICGEFPRKAPSAESKMLSLHIFLAYSGNTSLPFPNFHFPQLFNKKANINILNKIQGKYIAALFLYELDIFSSVLRIRIFTKILLLKTFG